jgi:Bax protein
MVYKSFLFYGKELSDTDKLFLDSLLLRYESDSYENLLERLKPNPTSLVLAQAAIESGWGQSRFALEGNNLFGIMATAYDKE